jgi:hypothetical protein
MNREDTQSLELTKAALRHAAERWPEAKQLMLRNIATIRSAESCSERYIERWEELIQGRFAELCAVVLADTDEGQVLRSASPLAGLIPEEERLEIIRVFWQRHREGQRIKLPSTRRVETLEGSGLNSDLSEDEGRRRISAYATHIELETWAGPVASARELHEQFGITTAALRNWRERRMIIELSKGRARRVYPVAQFVNGQPIAGLAEINRIILSPQAAWLWLVSGHPSLRGARPIKALKSGRIKRVLDIAMGNFCYVENGSNSRDITEL